MRSLSVCRSLWSCWLLVSVCLAIACDPSTSQDPSAPAAGGSTNKGDVAVPEGTDSASAIAFDPTQYTLPVLSRTELKVQVLPPITGVVTFALTGASLDASLEAASAVIDEDGYAGVTLTTASQPTTFSVRASLQRGVSTEAQIQVVEALSGAVNVTSKYAGSRRIEQYTYSVYPDRDCTSPLLGQDDSTRITVRTTSAQARVEGVPLTKSLAVVVEGDAVVRGCMTTRAVAGQSSTSIQVPLEDLPINLSGATLQLSLTTTGGNEALMDGTGAAIPSFVAHFVPGNHDLIQLLTLMEQVATGSLRQEFSDTRRAGNWDAFVVTAYGAPGADLLRTALRRWLESGVSYLANEPIGAQLTLGRDESAPAQLTLMRVAGLDAKTQLEARSDNLALSVEPKDHLSWSATTTIGKYSLFAALAQKSASLEFPASVSLPAQLAELVNCESFGSRLDANALWDQSNTRTCTQVCLATLCRSALNAMADQASAGGVELGAFSFEYNASGTVTVDAHATPTAISGTWVGALTDLPTSVSFSGAYTSE